MQGFYPTRPHIKTTQEVDHQWLPKQHILPFQKQAAQHTSNEHIELLTYSRSLISFRHQKRSVKVEENIMVWIERALLSDVKWWGHKISGEETHFRWSSTYTILGNVIEAGVDNYSRLNIA